MSNVWVDATGSFWANPPFAGGWTDSIWVCDCGPLAEEPGIPSWLPNDNLLRVAFAVARPSDLPAGPYLFTSRDRFATGQLGTTYRTGAHVFVIVYMDRIIDPAVLPFDLLTWGAVEGMGTFQVARTVGRGLEQRQQLQFRNNEADADLDMAPIIEAQRQAAQSYVYPAGSPDPFDGTLLVPVIDHTFNLFAADAWADSFHNITFDGPLDSQAEVTSMQSSAVAWYASELAGPLGLKFNRWRDLPLDFYFSYSVFDFGGFFDEVVQTDFWSGPCVKLRLQFFYGPAPDRAVGLEDYYPPAPGVLLQEIELDPTDYGWHSDPNAPRHFSAVAVPLRKVIQLSKVPLADFVLWMQTDYYSTARSFESMNYPWVLPIRPAHSQWSRGREISFSIVNYQHIDDAVAIFTGTHHPALRLNQRADGLGVNPAPRLSAANNATSEQGAPVRRVGGRNTFI